MQETVRAFAQSGDGGKRFFLIHGHFYQPTRESPWLEPIEVEDPAVPYSSLTVGLAVKMNGHRVRRLEESFRR